MLFFVLTLLPLLFLITGALSCGVIDVNTEHILTLSQLARRLPHRRADRPVHPATIHRWRHPGVCGVQLECVRIGGVWVTSLEAYQRWVERLTVTAQHGEPTPAPVRSDHHSMPQPEVIERQLDDLGL